MTNWKTYKIGDLVKFQRGHDLPKTKVVDGKYPIAGSNGIIGYHNEYTTEGPGITIGRSGNIGNPHIYMDKFWAHNTTLYVKEFYKVNPVFFYYFLRTMDFALLNSGSAVPSLNRNYIHPFEVSIPTDLPTQKAIAEILSSLDDKIELNNQMNKTLEEMAQAVFTKMCSFEDEMPDGWNIRQLGDIIEVKGGTTPSTKIPEYWDGDISWTSPKDLSNIQFPVLLDTDKRITELGLKKISSGLLPKGTLLLSSRAPIGYLAISNIPVAINQGYIAILCKKEVSNLFMLFWLKQNMNKVLEKANGSTFLEISKTNFKQIEAIIPDKNRLKEFDIQAKELFEMIVLNEIQNQKIKEIRDTLLPKLLSGEIDVSEAENIIEESEVLSMAAEPEIKYNKK
ncbi:MAG: restriction endonuclease subunit S [Bacteroidales bacterium]|nr:restriction endonuclease subunit S [Bacteroidales bacterium]